jgi:hypothetical protein
MQNRQSDGAEHSPRLCGRRPLFSSSVVRANWKDVSRALIAGAKSFFGALRRDAASNAPSSTSGVTLAGEVLSVPRPLQRLQKGEQRFLIRGLQLEKPLGYLRGFSPVAADGVVELNRVAVVHQA